MKTITINAAELIEKYLDYETIQKNDNIVDTITKSYQIAEQDLMTYVGKQAKKAENISELVNCFYYACHGFGALGSRADRLESKLIGQQKAPAVSLDNAVRKDVDLDIFGNDLYGFDRLDLPGVRIINDWQKPDEVDWQALAVIPILDYLLQGNYDALRIGDMLSGLTQNSCLTPLLDHFWNKRSLVGYFDIGYLYKLDISNKTFVKIFSDALTRLLDDSIDSLQIREHMHHILLKGWSDNYLFSPLNLYSDLEKLIDRYRANGSIETDLIGSMMTYDIFAIKKAYTPGFAGYELDIQGLNALADMLRDLGLENLQGASQYINMIESLTN